MIGCAPGMDAPVSSPAAPVRPRHGALDPLQSLRELLIALDAVLPFVHLPRDGSGCELVDLQRVREAQACARRLLRLPWVAVLEASSTHLDESERAMLADGAPPDPFLSIMACDHGWLLHVPTTIAPAAPLGPGLANLFAAAARQKIAYVRVDDDAPLVPDVDVLS